MSMTTTVEAMVRENSKKREWDKRWMRVAMEKASWSKDPSTQCGAIIVDATNREVGAGYNGFPRGVIDFDAKLNDREQKYPRVIHAELNACLFLSGNAVMPLMIYVYPFTPCSQCMGAIIQVGITQVITMQATDELKARWGTSNDIAMEMAAQAGVLVRTITMD